MLIMRLKIKRDLRFKKTLELRLIQTMRMSLTIFSQFLDVQTEKAGGLILNFFRDLKSKNGMKIKFDNF